MATENDSLQLDPIRIDYPSYDDNENEYDVIDALSLLYLFSTSTNCRP